MTEPLLTHFTPHQISAATDYSQRYMSTIDAPEIPATFRGDGYRVPSRRVDTTTDPLSVTETDASYSVQTRSAITNENETNRSPRAQGVALGTSNDPPVEFPVLLGHILPQSANELQHNSYSKSMETITSRDLITPFGAPTFVAYPKLGMSTVPSGTTPLRSSDEQTNSVTAYRFSKNNDPPTCFPAIPVAWGSLPLAPPASHQPCCLPNSPYVSDCANVSLRTNIAASNFNNSLTTPAVTMQANSNQLSDPKFLTSFPIPQCPVLSGAQSIHNAAGSTSRMPAQYALPVPPGYGYNYTDYSPSISAPQWGYPSNHYVYGDAVDEDGRWTEADPSFCQYYHVDPYQLHGCTLIPLPSTSSYVPEPFNPPGSMKVKAINEGEPLWNPPQPQHFRDYKQSGRNVEGFRGAGGSVLREIESRVVAEGGRKRELTNNKQCPSLHNRRNNVDWGQVVPSQEERKSKKWWTFCSST